MSSCFSVDVSFSFLGNYLSVCYFSAGVFGSRARVHLPIIAGSGAYQNSTMHTGQGNVNYVSYFVKRIQLNAEYCYLLNSQQQTNTSIFPDYAVLFKVPYREPVVDDMFNNIKDFILYKEPEHVLDYSISSPNTKTNLGEVRSYSSSRFYIDLKKPFIVGPNDYVGVFYFITAPRFAQNNLLKVEGTAKVWFDPV